MKNFSKNDQGFECIVCGKKVEPLGYTSRDHCPFCLHSLHVDINPGDRQNSCHGILKPIGCSVNSKKGYVIHYICQKCGQSHNNKSAEDDKMSLLFALMNGTFDKVVVDKIKK